MLWGRKGVHGVGNTWPDPSSFQSCPDFLCVTCTACSPICVGVFWASLAWKAVLSSSVTHQRLQQCMRVCCPVCVPVCLGCAFGQRGREGRRVEGRGGVGVGCSIWSLTCCGALLRPPCLEVSSAGIGRLHASSIRGSILLLP